MQVLKFIKPDNLSNNDCNIVNLSSCVVLARQQTSSHIRTISVLVQRLVVRRLRYLPRQHLLHRMLSSGPSVPSTTMSPATTGTSISRAESGRSQVLWFDPQLEGTVEVALLSLRFVKTASCLRTP